MGLLPKNEPHPSARLVALTLASGLPFFAYLATASAHGYWLDAGELVAAAVDLDIAHPPGHPLAALLGRAFSYLPFGPIPFRVALGQAACAAGAAAFFFSAFHVTALALGAVGERVALALAVGATWLVAGAPGWWLQAVRPEVYALEALLCSVVIERCVVLEARWPTHDVRPLYVAALFFGLSLANHHFVGFLVLPAVAPTLARVMRARGTRPLVASAAFALVGLLPYAYLPIRAGTAPPMDLGHPTDLASMFWVVSAQAYQHTSALTPDPLVVRFIDVGESLVTNLHALPCVFALAGAYALFRTPGARRIGWIWSAVLVLSFVGRGWLGFVRGNPDAAGYLMPAYAAGAALALAFVAAVVSQLASPRAGKESRSAIVIGLLAGLFGLAQLRHGAEEASLASFHSTDDFDEPRVRALPTRAVVVSFLPQTIFRHWGTDAVDRTRPDVTLVPVPFLAYPGVADALRRREPDLRGVLGSFIVEGELRAPELQSLAARRPVEVELDVRVPLTLYDTLAPRGLFHEVVDGGATASDVREAAALRLETMGDLEAALGREVREPETTARLLWILYTDALYFGGVGALEPARVTVARALELAPASPELLGLRAALAAETRERPIDVRPFMVGPAE